jgi:hypothetical protein
MLMAVNKAGDHCAAFKVDTLSTSEARRLSFIAYP